MRLVFLSQGKCTLVDKEDIEFLNQWKWNYDATTGYAYRRQHFPSTRKHQICKKIYMHQLINKTPTGKVTDHINRNKLDNRRFNLRSATHSQNHINKGMQANNTSGIKGVSWSRRDRNWIACLVVGGEPKLKKSFKSLEDAKKARREAEALYHV